MSEGFTYTYSAADSGEAEKIRQKYAPKTKEGNAMETLRKLDASAETAGRIAAVTIGTISALLLGVGMCCTMVWTDLARLYSPIAFFNPLIFICLSFPFASGELSFYNTIITY